MKKNIRNKKMIGILLIAFIILTTKVYAAGDKFETTLKASSSNIKRESTVTITIGLDKISIENGDKGIGGYTGKIRFDSSVLEYVSATGTDKWEKPTYQDGLITATTSDGEVVKTTQSIATITFKVKKDAKLGESIISLENFSGTNAVNDISTDNKSIKVTIVDQNSGSGNNGNSGNNDNSENNNEVNNNDIGNNNDNNNQNVENNNSNTNNNVNNNQEENKDNSVDNTTQDGKLPQTGTTDVIIFIAIGACSVLGIISFIKMRKK